MAGHTCADEEDIQHRNREPLVFCMGPLRQRSRRSRSHGWGSDATENHGGGGGAVCGPTAPASDVFHHRSPPVSRERRVSRIFAAGSPFSPPYERGQ